MKIRIIDRILVAVAGLILLASCAALVAQVFFRADVTGFAARVLAGDSFGRRAALTLIALGLLLLGVYCMMIVFRHRRKKDQYVLQKNENGELAISMSVLDQMVRKCLGEHPELDAQGLELENRRDGLLIRIRTNAAGGISIPLTVEALQKQIRQYVTACSGVEISAVQVEIETTGEDAADAAFAVPAPAATRLLREPEAKTSAETAKAETPGEPAPEQEAGPEQGPGNAEAAPAARNTEESVQAEAPAGNRHDQTLDEALDKAILEEEDDRPMHVRLFSAQPEPCIIPEPPAENPEEAEISGGDGTTESDQNDAGEETEAESSDAGPEPEKDADTDRGNPVAESADRTEEKQTKPDQTEDMML